MNIGDLVTALLAPVGIWFGWFLNERSTRNGVERAARLADEAEERARVIQAVRQARAAGGQLRSVMHAMYLKGMGSKPVGFQEAIEELNSNVDAFRDATLALRVQGPSWAVAGAERINVQLTRLMELSQLMQNLTSAHVDAVNRVLPEFDQIIYEYVSAVSQHYNSEAQGLPVPPDMEKEGRWQVEEGK